MKTYLTTQIIDHSPLTSYQKFELSSSSGAQRLRPCCVQNKTRCLATIKVSYNESSLKYFILRKRQICDDVKYAYVKSKTNKPIENDLNDCRTLRPFPQGIILPLNTVLLFLKSLRLHCNAMPVLIFAHYVGCKRMACTPYLVYTM